MTNIHANHNVGCKDNLQYLHTLWDFVKMHTTGDWFDVVKETLQYFYQCRQIARTHMEARALIDSDFQTVVPQSAIAQVLALNGLRNIPSPRVSKLTLSTGLATQTTTGIPPGEVVDHTSFEETDGHAMFFQDVSDIETYTYKVNRNGILNNHFNFVLPILRYGVSNPLEDADIPQALPNIGQKKKKEEVAAKPQKTVSPTRAAQIFNQMFFSTWWPLCRSHNANSPSRFEQ